MVQRFVKIKCVFAGNYRYVAEGPFQIMTNTPSIAVKANTQIDIKVVPKVRLTASVVSKSGTYALLKSPTKRYLLVKL